MKFRLLLPVLFFFSFGISQEMSPPPLSVKIDSLIVSSSEFSADSLLEKNPVSNNEIYPKNFRDQFRTKYKSPDFDYNTAKPRESFWQKFKRKIGKILQSLFGEVDPTKAVNYTVYIVRFFAVVVIGFLIYLILKFVLSKDGNFFFGRKNKKIMLNSQDLLENIHEINFADSIANSERNRDYRSAVRYHFLSVLKGLADQKRINWNPEKTNKDYLLELKDNDSKAAFKELILIFEYIWYGDFDINVKNYDQYKQKFLKFKN